MKKVSFYSQLLNVLKTYDKKESDIDFVRVDNSRCVTAKSFLKCVKDFGDYYEDLGHSGCFDFEIIFKDHDVLMRYEDEYGWYYKFISVRPQKALEELDTLKDD